MKRIDKASILHAMATQLDEEIRSMTKHALDAAEAATHEENKPENDKDMRSTEASYLARGQALRVKELELAKARLFEFSDIFFADGSVIDLGAYIETHDGKRKQAWILLPVAGGIRVQQAELMVQSITTQSPLGEALVGQCAGEEIEVETPTGLRTYKILAVQ